jgi:Ca-activated chloride channel family protein
MLRLFGKTASQGITDFSVDWAGMKAEQAPAAPALFLDTPASLFARLDGEPDLTRPIRLKGKIGGLEKIWELDPVAAGDQTLPARLLWVRDRIRDLEESEGGVDAIGSRQKERKRDKVKNAIIDLSKEYGLLSRFTSFVAIEERQEKDKVTGEAVLRKVPVLVTTGWHGRGSVFGSPAQVPSSRVMLSISPVAFDAPVAEPHSLFRRSAADLSSVSLKPPWDTATESVKDDLDLVLLILSRQKAGGGIEMDMDVSKALGLDLDEIKKTADLIKGSLRVDRFLLLSTALLLSVLELRFASERSTWEGAVKKSRDWLDGIMKRGKPKVLGVPLTEWARAYAARGK